MERLEPAQSLKIQHPKTKVLNFPPKLNMPCPHMAAEDAGNPGL